MASGFCGTSAVALGTCVTPSTSVVVGSPYRQTATGLWTELATKTSRCGQRLHSPSVVAVGCGQALLVAILNTNTWEGPMET